MEEKQYYVYILANKKYGTLYIGVTGNLIQRVHSHKNDLVESFTKQYKIHRLVYYEIHSDIKTAIQRETTLKAWRRDWKINLIEQDNPEWVDLFLEL